MREKTNLLRGTTGKSLSLTANIKAQSLPKKPIFTFLLILLIGMGVWFVSSIPQVYDYNTNGTTTNASFFEVNYNWTCDDASGFCPMNYSWDDVNYSKINYNMVLMMNMNNNSNIQCKTGFENNSCIRDFSFYRNDGIPNESTTPTTNGKNLGGFSFLGDVDRPINLGNSSSLVFIKEKNYTWSFWVNITDNSANGLYDKMPIILLSDGNHFDFIEKNTSGWTRWQFNTPSVDYVKKWKNYVVVYEGSNQRIRLYIDGIEMSTLNNYYNWSARTNSSTKNSYLGYSYAFKGIMDEVKMWNYSLSNDEIVQNYYSFIFANNQTNWIFYSNQSLNYSSMLLNYTNQSKDIWYGIYVGNASGDTSSSGLNKLTQTMLKKNIYINFTSLINITNPYFYGIGFQSPKLFSGSLDTNCDGIYETSRNYTLQRELYLNSGGNIAFYDGSLGSYYDGVINVGFENWRNISTINITSNLSYELVNGWLTRSYRDEQSLVYRTNDSHSGNYALQINDTKSGGSGSSTVFETFTTSSLSIGKNYTASIWLKGNGAVSPTWFYGSTGITSKSITLNSTWQRVQISVVPDATQTGEWRYRIGLSVNTNLTIDDFEISQDGIITTWWMGGNLTNMQNQLYFDYQHNKKSVVILNYMPSFLANRSIEKCVTNLFDTNDNDCMPFELEVWNNITLDFYKQIDQYRNSSYLQLWNEPNGVYFEDKLAGNSAKTDFVILFNNSYYTFFNYNPNIIIAGYRTTGDSVTSTYFSPFNIMMLSNLSNEFKYFSFHPYDSGGYINPSLGSISSRINVLLNNCSFYGAECRYIFLDEWQPAFSLRNESLGQGNRYKAEISYGLIDMLNNYPERISEFPYHWDDPNSYFNCPSLYSEYPKFFSSISEKGLDNLTDTILYPTYTIPQLFSQLCQVNGGIYQSLDQDNSTISCNINNQYAIISLNIKNYTQNNSICAGVDYPYSNITNFITKEVYSLLGTDKCFYIIQDSYQEGGSNNILYLSSGIPPTISSIQPANLTINTTSQVNFSTNLTDDVGLTNSTLNIMNTSDNTLIQNVVNYVSGEITVIQSWLITLADGVYHWWISLFDDEGKETISGNYTETIAVPPTFTTIPNNQSIQFGNESLLVIFTGTDETAFDTYSVNDSRFSINDTGFLRNITNTPVGNYSMNITINDTHNNINWTIFTLQVRDTIFPLISFEPQTTNSSNFSQSNIYINVTTNDLSNHSVLSNVGLKLWLRYNNETGENNTYALDYSGYGNNITGFNGTLSNSSGKFDKCIKLNGTSYFKSTNDSSLNITDAITVSTWIKLDSYASYRRVLVKSPIVGAYPYTTYGLLLDSSTGGFSRIRMELASGGYQHLIRSTTNLTNGQWYLVTGVWNGSDNSAKIYINGILDNSTLVKAFANLTEVPVSNLYNGKIDTNTNYVTVGSSSYLGDGLNGSLDDSMIYNRGLSANEVMALYNATRLDHNITNLNDGNYNVTVYAQDSSGNVNSTSRWVSLDTVKPTFDITNPSENYEYEVNLGSYETIVISGNANDLNFNSSKYTFTYANGTTLTNLSAYNLVNFNVNLTNSTYYYMYWNATDKAGNFNETTRTFRVKVVSGGTEGSETGTSAGETDIHINSTSNTTKTNFLDFSNNTLTSNNTESTSEETKESDWNKFWNNLTFEKVLFGLIIFIGIVIVIKALAGGKGRRRMKRSNFR